MNDESWQTVNGVCSQIPMLEQIWKKIAVCEGQRLDEVDQFSPEFIQTYRNRANLLIELEEDQFS